MAGLLDPRTERRGLDVGTGTGVVALEVARRLGSGGTVVGVDLSDTMLRAARRKAEAAGLGDRARFERADAESIPHDDASFDAVVSLCWRPAGGSMPSSE
jgi:ubiquinone/menaquinone biosynthesis C-methylase UbiE